MSMDVEIGYLACVERDGARSVGLVVVGERLMRVCLRLSPCLSDSLRLRIKRGEARRESLPGVYGLWNAGHWCFLLNNK